MRTRGVVLLSVGLLVATAAGAGEESPSLPQLPEWGTTAQFIYNLHAFEFVPIESTTTYLFNNWMKVITGGYPALVAGVHLPTGASIDFILPAVCDEEAAQDVMVRLWRCPSGPFTDPCTAAVVVSSVGVDGCAYIYPPSGPFPITVNNATDTYFVEFNGYSGTITHRLDHVRFYCRLQVSPAPASATFADVPTNHGFFQYVEALAASGITAGCGGGNYCPDAPLTRGQMAVFLSKALGLHWAP